MLDLSFCLGGGLDAVLRVNSVGHLLFVLNALCLIATLFKFSGMLLLVFSVLLVGICCWRCVGFGGCGFGLVWFWLLCCS